MALELKLSEIKPVPVTFNYEELKKEVAERTAPYKGLIVEEDAIPVAKNDLANLRKLEKAMRAAKMARIASTFMNQGGLSFLTGR